MNSLLVSLLHTFVSVLAVTFVIIFYAYVVDDIRFKRSRKFMQRGYDEAVEDIVERGYYWNRGQSKWTYVRIDILEKDYKNENY